MVQILKNLEAALQMAGAQLTDVVRTRVYVTNMENWQQIGKAHGEVFAEIRPASCMVEVSRLINPQMLVELEADAYVAEQG
jgi:enamine deaminase RidA (YjgF/YER057c/UK114 family)